MAVALARYPVQQWRIDGGYAGGVYHPPITAEQIVAEEPEQLAHLAKCEWSPWAKPTA